ncbi:MAG: hypothetical protein R3E32_23850 [Chitinophagales bacterium]
MNYKPVFIVLGTFIIGMMVGLLLAGVVIRKQLEPVRNLQTAKGIKNMVTEILANDTSNQAIIFELLNENIAEMQVLDLEYRAEMQINMDSLAKDLQPLLNSQQNLALQKQIEANRQIIDKRFEKSKQLQELEQRIEDLELQITEQIKADNQELAKETVQTNVKSNPPSNPTYSTSNQNNSISNNSTSIDKKLEINQSFIKDILSGYYGGNPRLINAFFMIRFNQDTTQFQDFVKQHFTGDIHQLQRVLNKQFRIKNRLRRFNNDRPFRPTWKEDGSSANTSLPQSSTTVPQNPTLVPDPKEQTLENESLNPPSINTPSTKYSNEIHTRENNMDYLPKDRAIQDRVMLTPIDRILINRTLQNRFAGDTLAMQQFINDKFQSDTLLFLQTVKQKFREQRQKNR